MANDVKHKYEVQYDNFKTKKIIPSIHSQGVVGQINGYIDRYGVQDSFDLLVCIESLEGLSIDFIDAIDEKFKYFYVQDWQHELYANVHIKGEYMTDGKGNKFETARDYAKSYCIYTREELKEIIRKIQQIEKGLDGLDDFQKLAIIYDRIKRNVSYTPDRMEKSSLETRSLRGLISGESVCAGYATIFQHVLQRQGIVSKFVGGTYSGCGHAWNVVVLNGNQYGLDVMGDSELYHKGKRGMDAMEYFGKKGFMEKRVVTNNTGASDYGNISDFESDGFDVGSVLGLSELQILRTNSNKNQIFTRKDGTSFFISEIGSKEMNVATKNGNKNLKFYKYVYIPCVKDKLDMSRARMVYSGSNIAEFATSCTNQDVIDVFVNDVMSENNIEESVQKGSGFVGVSLLSKGSNSAVMHNPEEVQKHPAFNISNSRRIGLFVVDRVELNGKFVFNFYSADVSTRSLRRQIIYSETDLFVLPNNVLDRIFDSANINRIINQDGGYLGSIDQNGQIIQDPNELARRRAAVGIKAM